MTDIAKFRMVLSRPGETTIELDGKRLEHLVSAVHVSMAASDGMPVVSLDFPSELVDLDIRTPRRRVFRNSIPDRPRTFWRLHLWELRRILT